MKDGFIKVSAVTPEIVVADTGNNAQAILKKIEEANSENVKIIVFPQLCVTGSTAGDLFLCQNLLDGATTALKTIADGSKTVDALIFIGMPLKVNGVVADCSAVLLRGKVLAFVPNGSLTYEQKRFFSVVSDETTVQFFDETVPVTSVPFVCENNEVISIEVTFGNAQPKFNANIVVNLNAQPHYLTRNASNEVYAIALLNLCAVVRAEAGYGESTTDGAYLGHNTIVEYDAIKKDELDIYIDESATAVVDAGRIAYIRSQQGKEPCALTNAIRFTLNDSKTDLNGVEWNDSPTSYWAPCEALDIQVTALAKRMESSRAKTAVIGLSGGLDSTLALLVAVETFDFLKRDRKEIIAVTMPCFGTTSRTKNNAVKLANGLGVTLKTIPVRESVKRHLKDIGHDGVTTDVTYENAQARERTQVLMDVANMQNGLVIGTGDMSELALGWATYNGDHMSMYAVNAGVTKTLVREIVESYADRCDDIKIAKVLKDILLTPVSPELIPGKKGEIEQKTEDLVGPYELHDFFLYNMLANGYGAGKLYRVAKLAFSDKYDEQTVEKWLRTFIRRFFAQQFKRSCMPDGPKVLNISLSPRGGLVMPSDASSKLWLDELDKAVKGEN